MPDSIPDTSSDVNSTTSDVNSTTSDVNSTTSDVNSTTSDVNSTTSSDYNSSTSSDLSLNENLYRIAIEIASSDVLNGETFYLPIDPEPEVGTSNGSSTVEQPEENMDLRYEDFEFTRPTIYEEGSVYTIPLFSEINLIPGEVWPMAPKFRNVQFILEWALKQLPFGACNKINENDRTFGTIAVISSHTENNHTALIGHQRFEVLEILSEGVLTCTEARVKIIKDTTLYYPLTKLCLDKKNRSFGDSRICSKRSMFQTLWPSWVYKQFDVYELASNITKKIKILNQNVRISDDPIFLSFQVTKLGLFSETQINELFGIDSTNLRLQLELNFLNNLNVVEEYVCAGSDCGVQVCNLKTMFSVSSTQTHKSNCKYWNSSRDMITISYLDDYVNKIKFVNKSTECSCFPGYNSTSIICKTCNSHLGWSFVVNGSMSVMPTSFYGLSITALIKSSVKIDP